MAANVSNSTKYDDKPGRAKMYKCDKCDHASSRKSSLAQHIARVHEVEEGSESDQSGDEGESKPESENSTMSVKMVGVEESNRGEADNAPSSKRAPLAVYNKALNDPDHRTENVNFAIPISLESLGFLEGLSQNELL